MTEDEAKTKWCPFVRLSAPVDSEASGTSGNRYGDDVGGNFRCIASTCMAWRWRMEQTNRREAQLAATWPPQEPIYRQTDSGYCGLAGGSL